MATAFWHSSVVRLNGELFVVNSGSLTIVYLSPSIICTASRLVIVTPSDDRRCVTPDNVVGVEENTGVECRVPRADIHDEHNPYFTYCRTLLMRNCGSYAIHDAFERGLMQSSAHEIAAQLY